ncbi:MAG: hypothetical protein LBK69_03250, partial [Syntrophomonadaceae bacterium]|nr:hypothetical protein [Syntrophomonadaceae bacterium]
MEQLDILTSFGALIKNDKNMGILTKAKTNKNNDFNAKLNNQLHKQNDNVSSINNRDKAVKDKMTVGDNELVHAKELDVEGTEKYQNVNSEDKNVSERQEIVSQEAVAREDVFPAVIPSVTGNIPITTAFFDADVVAENIILPIVTAETSISDGGTANGFFTDLEATLAQSVLKTDVPVVMADNEQSSEMFMNV